jgi:hypothetical protein
MLHVKVRALEKRCQASSRKLDIAARWRSRTTSLTVALVSETTYVLSRSNHVRVVAFVVEPPVAATIRCVPLTVAVASEPRVEVVLAKQVCPAPLSSIPVC